MGISDKPSPATVLETPGGVTIQAAGHEPLVINPARHAIRFPAAFTEDDRQQVYRFLASSEFRGDVYEACRRLYEDVTNREDLS